MSRPPPDPIFTLRQHTGEVTSLNFRNELVDGYPSLLSGSTTGEVFLWNLKTYRVDARLEAHEKKQILWVGSLQNTVLTQGRDGVVNLWSCNDNDWKICRSIPTQTIGFCQCNISELRNLIAVPGEKSCQIDIVDLETCNSILTLMPDSPDTYGLCICTKWVMQHNHLLCGYENGKVILWDVNRGSEISHLTCHKEPVFGLDFDDKVKQEGISCSAEEDLCVFSVEDSTRLVEKNRISLPTTGASSVAVRQDGKIVASGGWDGIIRLFSWKTLKPLVYLNFHRATINCLKFYDGESEQHSKLLAAGSKDKRITLWSVYRDK